MDNLRNNGLGIKEGDKITFEYYDTIYTKKVQTIYIEFNGLTKYNVNKIGSGTGCTGIDADEVIKITKKK